MAEVAMLAQLERVIQQVLLAQQIYQQEVALVVGVVALQRLRVVVAGLAAQAGYLAVAVAEEELKEHRPIVLVLAVLVRLAV
jgi:hypothetical protein